MTKPLALFAPDSVHVGDVLPNGWTLLAYCDYATNPDTFETLSQSVLALVNDPAERQRVDGNYATFLRQPDERRGEFVDDLRFWRNIHDASNYMQEHMGNDR